MPTCSVWRCGYKARSHITGTTPLISNPSLQSWWERCRSKVRTSVPTPRKVKLWAGDSVFIDTYQKENSTSPSKNTYKCVCIHMYMFMHIYIIYIHIIIIKEMKILYFLMRIGWDRIEELPCVYGVLQSSGVPVWVVGFYIAQSTKSCLRMSNAFFWLNLAVLDKIRHIIATNSVNRV